MRITRLILALAGLGLACLALGSVTAKAACGVSVRQPWPASGAQKLAIVAHALGQSCGAAVVVLVVTDAKDKPLWATSRLAEHVALFQEPDIATPKGMMAALKTWISTGLSTSPASSAKLPAWQKGQDNPLQVPGEEFGYFAGQDMSAEFYEELRQKKLPVFCFVQGLESESCIVADPKGGITEFGGRTFPG